MKMAAQKERKTVVRQELWKKKKKVISEQN